MAEHWAALPQLPDHADTVPASQFSDLQQFAEIDVFFVHPTTFYQKDERWNAPLEEETINQWTDKGPILHQASIFNGSGKIYAPRYRQAHLKSYWHLKAGGKQALDTAYADVLAAFDHYINHYNNGRPFIIAAHSQGTTHGVRLLRERIDTTHLANQLVCAYLVGMRVVQDEFTNIPPCTQADDCGCFVSWMTFDKGYRPGFYTEDYVRNAIHNPLTWQMKETDYSDRRFHQGIVTSKFELKYKQTISAKVNDGLLWIKKPHVPVLKWFITEKNWHKADYNLFWVDIRQNVSQRCDAFQNLHMSDK
ncbi:MAG: DUF3089 domain-containing protein [Flavobacteriales bacterium]|nr:DUF3089 domain-containing protein [Flavobacteriales bacterium]